MSEASCQRRDVDHFFVRPLFFIVMVSRRPRTVPGLEFYISYFLFLPMGALRSDTASFIRSPTQLKAFVFCVHVVVTSLTQHTELRLGRDVLVLVGGRAAVDAGVVVGDAADDQVTARQQGVLLVPVGGDNRGAP